MISAPNEIAELFVLLGLDWGAGEF